MKGTLDAEVGANTQWPVTGNIIFQDRTTPGFYCFSLVEFKKHDGKNVVKNQLASLME